MKTTTLVKDDTNGCYQLKPAPGGGITVMAWRERDGQYAGTHHLPAKDLSTMLDGLVRNGYRVTD